MSVWDNKYRENANDVGLWMLAIVLGTAPYPVKNENDEECPFPFDPCGLVGAPLGQYHCPYCGAMVLAGWFHPNYDPDLMDDEEREMFGYPPRAPP